MHDLKGDPIIGFYVPPQRQLDLAVIFGQFAAAIVFYCNFYKTNRALLAILDKYSHKAGLAHTGQGCDGDGER